MYQKKKEICPEITPLTIKQIVTIKAKLSEDEDNTELTIKDLKMEEISPQAFDDVLINIVDGEHNLILADNVSSEKLKSFKKSKGGIFLKDSLAYNKGNEHGKYVLIEDSNEKKIIRLIEDEEILLFQTLKLINGIIKDKPYMLLRKIKEGEQLSSTKIYIKKNSENEETDLHINLNTVSIPIEEDNETVNSVSLFDE